MTDNICVGAGLVSLDILIRDGARFPIGYYVGGTCGNVMMILAHMGWDSFPIARLDGLKDTTRILEDMEKHGVHADFIIKDEEGKTPVIVQRNFVTKDGIMTHKFESRNSKGRLFLDFKPLTIKQADAILEHIDFVPKVFYFDKVAPAILKLANAFKEMGAVVLFEPSSKGGNINTFDQCVEVADIVKFSEQRIKDVHLFEGLKDKLIIQTLGADGLSFRFNSEWIHLEPVANDKVLDTSGAGDWTAAALINELFKNKASRKIESFSRSEIEVALNKAQAIGAKSCSYEGARGMMLTV